MIDWLGKVEKMLLRGDFIGYERTDALIKLARRAGLLEKDCQALSMGEAEAMALVMSHEGHIEAQDKRIAELEERAQILVDSLMASQQMYIERGKLITELGATCAEKDRAVWSLIEYLKMLDLFSIWDLAEQVKVQQALSSSAGRGWVSPEQAEALKRENAQLREDLDGSLGYRTLVKEYTELRGQATEKDRRIVELEAKLQARHTDLGGRILK